MLVLHARNGETRETAAGGPGTATLPRDTTWIDLLQPTPDEIAVVERATGFKIPSFDDLSEIETSSRVRTENQTLYLSAPLVYRSTASDPQTTPVGYVLSSDHLVTVRFEPLTAFNTFAEAAAGSATEMFVGLIDAIVDRIADVLEQIAAELDQLSHRLFRAAPVGGQSRRHHGRESTDLRVILRRVGANGDLVSKIRDSLLGLARIVPHVAGSCDEWLSDAVKLRLETLRHDIASLSDYDAHLVSKVQLLLDATLGLINAEQNNIIKVLTIVNVVGVPPTLVASIYGMNFKFMPELDWSWGYPFGLLLIALTAVAPLIWFKRRGWF